MSDLLNLGAYGDPREQLREVGIEPAWIDRLVDAKFQAMNSEAQQRAARDQLVVQNAQQQTTEWIKENELTPDQVQAFMKGGEKWAAKHPDRYQELSLLGISDPKSALTLMDQEMVRAVERGELEPVSAFVQPGTQPATQPQLSGVPMQSINPVTWKADPEQQQAELRVRGAALHPDLADDENERIKSRYLPSGDTGDPRRLMRGDTVKQWERLRAERDEGVIKHPAFEGKHGW